MTINKYQGCEMQRERERRDFEAGEGRQASGAEASEQTQQTSGRESCRGTCHFIYHVAIETTQVSGSAQASCRAGTSVTQSFISLMATATQAVVGSTLPALPKFLLNFFAKYPPKQYSAFYTGVKIPITRLSKVDKQRASSTLPEGANPSAAPPVAAITSASDPNASHTEPSISVAEDSIATTLKNPFMPWRNPETGRWHAPRYGLRKQANFVKAAKQCGVEALLPPSRKSTEFKQERALLRGLRVKGTGEGQRVKGHKWERQIDQTVAKRVQAMKEMPDLVREWKSKGHGRGWKKYPK